MESLKAEESQFLTSESSVKLAYTTGESCANQHNMLNTPKSAVYGNDTSINNVIRVEQFCRICGTVKDLDNLVKIFGDEGSKLDLEKKIKIHLQLKIVREDQLPLQVCTTCIDQLNICHSLYEVSQTADSKLRELFLLHQIPENDNDHCIMVPVEISSDMEVVHNIEEDPDTDKIPLKKEKSDIAESLLCDVCGKNFKLPSHLQSHKHTHLDDSAKKKHHCLLCSKSFRSKFHLSEHTNVHNGVTPYSCSECKKTFHKRSQLRQHTQIHVHDSKKAVCEVCGIRFSRRSNLRVHAKTHVEGRMFPCKLCQMQFPSFSAMLSHRRQHSQEDIKNRIRLGLLSDKNQLFTCEVCGTILTNKDSLVTHLAQHIQRCSLQCPDCGKQLRSQRSLKYHRRSQHTGERPYSCSFCPEGFMTRKLKEAHERRHTGEKPFTCEVCCKGFRSRNNLVQHKLKHNGEKNFKCSFCGKTFFRKGALTVHTRKHTGEKPFICDLCGRPFSQKNDMLKHQKTHGKLGSRTRTCELCLAVFNSTVELASHKDQVHKGNNDLVPLIITNNMFETLIITEDGQKLVVATEAIDENALSIAPTSIS